MKTFQQVKESTSIKSFEFDDETNLLTVEFKAGSEYTYADVPADVVDGFLNADSKGKYFSANIKDKFVTEKMSGIRLNPPRPWRFPKAEDFAPHGSDVEAAWPFPTSKKP